MKYLASALSASVVSSLLLAPSASAAGLLTFETTPQGAVPVDNASIANPYTITGGTVRLFFDSNGNNVFDSGIDRLPAFERVGDAESVAAFFATFANTRDVARPGFESRLGDFLLRSPDGQQEELPGSLVARYETTSAITELSGEIWDIDGHVTVGTEQWRVEVLGVAGDVLASQLSPLGIDNGLDSLDGLPWLFEFRGLPAGVQALRLTFVGTRTGSAAGVGVAFDNFSPEFAVPEPSMLTLPLAAVALLRRRRAAGASA